jgi:hypothetical protein
VTLLAGIWPTPIVEIASSIVVILVLYVIREVWRLSERVSRLEGRLNGRR